MKIEVSPNTSTGEIQRIYHVQKEHVSSAGNTPVKDRLAKIRVLRKVIIQHRVELQQAMYADYNKPAPEVDMAEMLVLLNEIRQVIKKLKSWVSKHRVGTPWFLFGANSYIQYEPKGQVLVISPWNFPIHLTLMPLIHSYAAGNVTLIKPSEYTPYTSVVVKKIIQSVFQEKEAAIVDGDVSVSQYLLTLKFNHIFFTGSPTVGKIVMQAAAAHLCSVTLELGGKSPLIIDESADLKTTCRFAATTKLINSGQFCISPDYAFVHEQVKDKFIAGFISQLEYKFGSTPAELMNGNYSLMVNGKQLQRVKGILEDALNKGARLEYGGVVYPEKEFIGPTILSGISEEMRICTEEIFGPLIFIKTYRDIQEVIDQINGGETPLSVYLFSQTLRVKQRIRQEVRTGGLTINSMGINYYNYNLPFGGLNQSGIGKSHGFWSFCEFSNAKAVMNQWSPVAGIHLVLPPFTLWTRRMMDWLLKLI